MCLRQPLHALEGKCLKTSTIRFVLLLALYHHNLLISADSLSAGHICHKIHCKKGEYKGPRGSTVVMQALAPCLHRWYGLWCRCPCRGMSATFGWSNVGQSLRVFWKALSRKTTTGTSNDLEMYSLQHSIACFNLFYRFFICQSFNTYTVYQPPGHQMLCWSTTMPRVWCTRSLWQQAGMWLVTDFMMAQQAQATSVTHASTTTWDCVQNSPNSNQWPQKS